MAPASRSPSLPRRRRSGRLLVTGARSAKAGCRTKPKKGAREEDEQRDISDDKIRHFLVDVLEVEVVEVEVPTWVDTTANDKCFDKDGVERDDGGRAAGAA